KLAGESDPPGRFPVEAGSPPLLRWIWTFRIKAGGMMVFVMDVGNTHIVTGIYRGDDLLHHWRIQTDRHATEDEYAMLFKNLFEHVGIRMEDITGVSISSVVPPLKRVLQLFVRKYFRLEPLMIGPGVKTGLNI